MNRIGLATAAIVAVSSLLAAGCQSAQVTSATSTSPGATSATVPSPGVMNTTGPPAGVPTKTGSSPVVLRFATIDDEVANPDSQITAPGVFLRALERVSGGRLKATVQTSFEDGEPSAETDIVTRIAAGTLDGGWPATRAFARAGIRGLEPIEAPFTLTSYAAERSLVTGPAAPALLKTLDASGVVGLGLTVGPLRRPWDTSHALVSPQQWRGVTFRSFNSPVQAAAIQALGGRPVSASFNFPGPGGGGKAPRCRNRRGAVCQQ